MSDWNAAQYLRFQAQRTQPAVDLVNRVPLENPADILDIGCGPGNSTRVLQKRFPHARIIGIDNSPEMIKTAKTACPELSFLLCDAGRELQSLERRFDLVFSNACIQWIPDHPALLRNMMALLKEGGVLAVQIPINFEEPIHRIIGALAKSEKWRDRFPNPRVFYTLGQGLSKTGRRNVLDGRFHLAGRMSWPAHRILRRLGSNAGRRGSPFADGPVVHNIPVECYGQTFSIWRPYIEDASPVWPAIDLKCHSQELPALCRKGRPFGCQEAYFDLLSELTEEFEIWQTTYVHRMKSHADIIEWYRGTGLRPYLDALSPAERIAFEQEVYTEIVSAYPRQKNGEILFRFPRLFFTAVRQKADGDKKEETL